MIIIIMIFTTVMMIIINKHIVIYSFIYIYFKPTKNKEMNNPALSVLLQSYMTIVSFFNLFDPSFLFLLLVQISLFSPDSL